MVDETHDKPSVDDFGVERGEPEKPKAHRGFRAMTPEKQREIASKGGLAAHAKGTAHQFTPEEAKAAGRKGGQSRALKLDSIRKSEIASMGGKALAEKRDSDV